MQEAENRISPAVNEYAIFQIYCNLDIFPRTVRSLLNACVSCFNMSNVNGVLFYEQVLVCMGVSVWVCFIAVSWFLLLLSYFNLAM